MHALSCTAKITATWSDLTGTQLYTAVRYTAQHTVYTQSTSTMLASTTETAND
jgi:hypothetical protein